MASSVSWPELKYPLAAVLRGVRPNEVEAIGDVLVEAGFEAIEVPLNSPDPLDSFERLARRHGEQPGYGVVARRHFAN